jgi:hypothetical protein
MATLYFNGAVDGDWNELDNWWNNDTFSTQATSLPSSSDSVVLSATCSTNSGSEPTVVNLTYSSGTLGIAITVTGTATFNDSSSNDGTITGNATFNDYATNGGGTVNGNATFNDYSDNLYIIDLGNGFIIGVAIFYDYATNNAAVGDGSIFNDNSRNGGAGGGFVQGSATFNDSSSNPPNDPVGGGWLTANAIFNDQSSNGGLVEGDATFNDTSYASGGTISGTATFNDTSYVSGLLTGDVIFLGNSYMASTAQVTGSATFRDNSYNLANCGSVIAEHGGGINGSNILGIL